MFYKRLATALLSTFSIACAASAQSLDPRAPGLYPCAPGATLATVTQNTWRANGDQIIIDYILNNPANEAVAVRPVFRSKTRPDFRLEPKAVAGAVGTAAETGPGNHVVWDFKRDTPQGLTKDEYYFAFELTSAEDELAWPERIDVVTSNQCFVVDCTKGARSSRLGVLVAKGGDYTIRPGQILTGDVLLAEFKADKRRKIIFPEDYYNISYTDLFNEDGSLHRVLESMTLSQKSFINNFAAEVSFFTSCSNINDVIKGDDKRYKYLLVKRNNTLMKISETVF